MEKTYYLTEVLIPQKEFVNTYGESAEPMTEVVGISEDKEEAMKKQKVVEEYVSIYGDEAFVIVTPFTTEE